MQVVRPGFSKVFPGMGRRISGYKPLLPVRKRSLRVMTLECSLIVLTIISKQGAAGLELAAITHKQIPVVVSDLMPKVTEQCAIGFAHLCAPPLALDVV